MKNSGDYDAKFIRSLERNFFSKYCFPEEKTTKHFRLLLPQKAIETLELQTSVYVVGVDTHLELFKNEESYKKTLI